MIARSLVNVAIFDREVQCRRAASAAFQENVGRQGTFPHGIDILTEADYFAVGSRQNTYLRLSVFVAGFGEYTDAVIDHLLATKVGHWDIGVRELTAEALHNLAPIAPEKAARTLLPALLKEVNAVELFTRHGAITSAGYVVRALSGVAKEKGQKLQDTLGLYNALGKQYKCPITSLLPVAGETSMSAIREVAVGLVQRFALRATGGDLLRQAVTSFIDNCARAGFPADADLVRLWKSILCENLSNVDPLIHEKAVAAVPHFLEQYYR